MIKSTSDPILDLRKICEECPRTQEELEAAYHSLGWGVPFERVFKLAQAGVYIQHRTDGLWHPSR